MTVEEFLGSRVVGVFGAGVAPALPDLVASRLQDLFVGGVFPEHQVFDDAEEPLPFFLLGLLGREEIGMGGRVVDHLREDHRPRRRQRPPRPPEVQRARVPVADRLLPALALLIASSGRATSMSFLRWVVDMSRRHS